MIKLVDLDLGVAFPHHKDEDWQFTDVSFLREQEFVLPQVADTGDAPTELDREPADRSVSLLIANGELLNNDHLVSGINITREHNLGVSGHTWDYFAQLNFHRQKKTIYISIDPNNQIDINIDYLTTQDRVLAQPLMVITLGANSQVTLCENFTSRSADYFHNQVTEIRLEPSAKLTHLRCQNQSLTSTHIATTVVKQSTHSYYYHLNLDLGAKLSRANPAIYTQGERTQTVLHGLTITNGQQVSDTHSHIHHSFAHGQSQQLHKCILADRSHGVFNGSIFVNKLAQETEAMQLNRTLLLSPQAKINTKPQLEIIADNVKCKHGATVSQLDPEACFYLESRGISGQNAKELLTYSFAGELLAGIGDADWRGQATKQVRQKLQECWPEKT